jgi:hypothetical protein
LHICANTDGLFPFDLSSNLASGSNWSRYYTLEVVPSATAITDFIHNPFAEKTRKTSKNSCEHVDSMGIICSGKTITVARLGDDASAVFAHRISSSASEPSGASADDRRHRRGIAQLFALTNPLVTPRANRPILQ